MESEERIQYAIKNTEVIRPPRQTLATFGITNIYYYLLTEPAYSELVGKVEETVVREGRVIAERPKIVTPSYLVNLFQGFQHGKEYAEYILHKYGPHEPGLLYQYRNEPKAINIVSNPLEAVVYQLNKKIDEERDPLATIIKGVDELWDISLMKFIHELTRNSLSGNIMEFGMRGFLDIEPSGIPRYAHYVIEQLFEEARKDRSKVVELEAELRRWNLFEEYEDRFFNLFRR